MGCKMTTVHKTPYRQVLDTYKDYITQVKTLQDGVLNPGRTSQTFLECLGGRGDGGGGRGSYRGDKFAAKLCLCFESNKHNKNTTCYNCPVHRASETVTRAYMEDKVIPLGNEVSQGTAVLRLAEGNATVHAPGTFIV